MKLFEKIQRFVQKTPKVEHEIFLSLILDESYIQAGAWELDETKKAHMLASTSERAAAPTWEDRIKMADHAIGKLEEETGSTKLSKVVLGLGEQFLTGEGDIEKSIRPYLKLLTKSLALSPLGFVPLSTSIAHFLRKSEGIPTSVILVGITEKSFEMSIYRVGRLSYSASIKRTESEGEDIENGLKGCADADVLPSRILLYGADDVRIQETKSLLLRHQWTSRANFLHYPKIEIFPFEEMIHAVIEAGASEITHTVGEESDEEPTRSEDIEEVIHEKQKKEEESLPLKEEPEILKEEEKGISHMVVVQPETLGFHEERDIRDDTLPHMTEESIKKQENIVENPLEFDEKTVESEMRLDKDDRIVSSSVFTSFLSTCKKFIHIFLWGVRRAPMKIIGVIALIILCLGGGFWWMTYYLPKVKITISVLPEKISYDDIVIIDPQATVIDTQQKIIPGKKLEKVVSGEKTIATTGKKKIGDPAKGTVVIFNKSEGAAYTLKKGTVITTGTIQFTLDTEVSIASASTSLSGDQLTFGKASTAVTAVAVGTEGNIAANKEFTIKEYGSNILVARNEQPFTGGTSKEVTVVSRTDYDTLLKTLTADLIEKAKTELTSSVTGKEQMIDQTVKTTVKEKKFTQEIDQEAKELHGSLSLSVSAFTYNEDDVKSLLSGVAQTDIPAGYAINEGRTTATIGTVTVAKDGKMTTKASFVSDALPIIDDLSLKKNIAGKNLVDVEGDLRSISGVASAEFVFQSAWNKNRLPTNPDHISIVVSIVE